jgi:tetratricopeptide (TPR) repeat protein
MLAADAADRIQNDNISDSRAAIEALTRAIELDPEFTQAYSLRALAYTQLEEHERAVVDYTQVIQLDAENIEAIYLRGASYAMINQPRRAIADYDRVIRLDPTHVFAYVSRALVFNTLEDYAVARSDLTRAIEIEPQFWEAYLVRGNICLMTGDYPCAVRDFQTFLAHRSRDRTAHSLLCTAQGKQKNYDAAIETCREAIWLDPYNSSNFVNRGSAYGSLGDFESACLHFEKACELGDCNTLTAARDSGYCP